jgi:hypothetical protein
MPTKRTLKQPKRVLRITSHAVELFRQMEALPECSCVVGPEHWQSKTCDACEEWRKLHKHLHTELKMKPWEWPAFEYPDADPEESKRSVVGDKRLEQARELYRQLKRLADEEA